MTDHNRQSELDALVAKALSEDSELARALKLFSMGQREYARALASLRTVTISSSAAANPGGDHDARSDRHDQGD